MRRSRSSSLLRSSHIVKEDVIMSVIDTINATLRYLANNTINKAAITAIRDYAKEMVDELNLFGVGEIYDSTQFSSVSNYIASYVDNKNKQTPDNEMFKIKPMKLSALSTVDHYTVNLKNVSDTSSPTGSVHFEKYLQNKLMDVQGFWGSPVIFRDQQTARIISEFNLAQQNNE